MERFPVDARGREICVGSKVVVAGLLGYIGTVLSLTGKDEDNTEALVRWSGGGEAGLSSNKTTDLIVQGS